MAARATIWTSVSDCSCRTRESRAPDPDIARSECPPPAQARYDGCAFTGSSYSVYDPAEDVQVCACACVCLWLYRILL